MEGEVKPVHFSQTFKFKVALGGRGQGAATQPPEPSKGVSGALKVSWAGQTAGPIPASYSARCGLLRRSLPTSLALVPGVLIRVAMELEEG